MTVEATSNSQVAAVVYLVPTSGQPVYGAKYVNPPVSRTLPATGGGLLGAIAVQAGANGETTTCRVTVDGVVRNERSVKGPYAVAVCYG